MEHHEPVIAVAAGRAITMSHSRLQRLSEHGQSVWIDYLSRDLLESGELARLIEEDAVVGVTSNPTIFQKAISSGSAYDSQLRAVRDVETDPKEVFYELVARDVAAASDLLLPIWEATNGLDGYVSWEIDPNFADDRQSSFDEAQRLHAWVDRPNLYVKIPATSAGVGAIEDTVAAGKNVNVTLIFSLQRYREVVEAYIHGLERLLADGGDPAGCPLRRELLRLAGRHGDRRAPRCDRQPRGAQGQARDRERQARVSVLPRGVLDATLGAASKQGSDEAAVPVGLDLDEEPGLPGRDVRRGPDRSRDGQHDARGHDPRLPGSRPCGRDADAGHTRGATPLRRPRSGSVSTTTTSSRRSNERASRSSQPRSPRFSTVSRRSGTGYRGKARRT